MTVNAEMKSFCDCHFNHEGTCPGVSPAYCGGTPIASALVKELDRMLDRVSISASM